MQSAGLHLVRYYASPGFVAESMDILLAEDLVHAPGEGTPDEDERIEVHPTPLSEAVRLALTGKLHDGKSLIGDTFLCHTQTALLLVVKQSPNSCLYYKHDPKLCRLSDIRLGQSIPENLAL